MILLYSPAVNAAAMSAMRSSHYHRGGYVDNNIFIALAITCAIVSLITILGSYIHWKNFHKPDYYNQSFGFFKTYFGIPGYYMGTAVINAIAMGTIAVLMFMYIVILISELL